MTKGQQIAEAFRYRGDRLWEAIDAAIAEAVADREAELADALKNWEIARNHWGAAADECGLERRKKVEAWAERDALKAECEQLRKEAVYTIRLAQDIEAKWPRVKNELEAERDAALAVLREIQWQGRNSQGQCCPWCKWPADVHDPDCRLAAVLATATPTTEPATDESTCPRCEGTGKYSSLGEPSRDCAVCDGKGIIAPAIAAPPEPPTAEPPASEAKMCPDCGGDLAKPAPAPLSVCHMKIEETTVSTADPDRGKAAYEAYWRGYAWADLSQSNRDDWNAAYDAYDAAMKHAESRVRAEERERCARIVEAEADKWFGTSAGIRTELRNAAAAIRNGGKT